MKKTIFSLSFLATTLLFAQNNNNQDFPIKELAKAQYATAQIPTTISQVPIVLTFWSSTDSQTTSKFEKINELANDLKETPIAFIALSRENKEVIAQYLEKQPKTNFPVGRDRGGDLGQKIKMGSALMTFIISKDAKIIWSGDLSSISDKELLSKLELPTPETLLKKWKEAEKANTPK